jgi:hypothetical protein
MQRRTRRLSLVCAVAVLLAAGAGLMLFVRAPRPLLRVLVERSSGWLLAERDGGGTPQRLLRTYVQTSLASHIAAPLLEQPGRDEEVLLRMMLAVRDSVVSARPPQQAKFIANGWPALIAGVGYCDQLNGAVCAVAAQHFPKAELVGLYNPVTLKSPHTIGRVWSEQRGEWLYFDAFYREPVIFTRDAKGQPRYLPLTEKVPVSKREVAPEGTYQLAGWKLTDFPPTFGMYLVRRVTDRFERSRKSAQQDQPVAAAAGAAGAGAGELAARPAAIPPDPVLRGGTFDDDLYRRVVATYAKARALHLLGEPARDVYRRVAADASVVADDRASELAHTARRFAERPEL